VSVFVLSSAAISISLCARLECVIITPLGSEVDPEVYCKNAISEGDGMNEIVFARLLPLEDLRSEITPSTENHLT
jgi:hypothetical protein